MQQQSTADKERIQSNVRQFVEAKRKSSTMRRETSSVMMPALRRSIEDSMRAGREPKYVAADYGTTQVLCVWLWARMMLATMDRRLTELEDAARPAGRIRLAA